MNIQKYSEAVKKGFEETGLPMILDDFWTTDKNYQVNGICVNTAAIIGVGYVNVYDIPNMPYLSYDVFLNTCRKLFDMTEMEFSLALELNDNGFTVDEILERLVQR